MSLICAAVAGGISDGASGSDCCTSFILAVGSGWRAERVAEDGVAEVVMVLKGENKSGHSGRLHFYT